MAIRKTLKRFLAPVAVAGYILLNISYAYINSETESNVDKKMSQRRSWIERYDSSYTVDGWNKSQMDVYPFVGERDSTKKEINWYGSPDSN